MNDAMREVARRLNVPADDADLLRLTNNAVFALPAAGMVIRITRSHGLHERVHKVVDLARWFASITGPTIRLAPGVEQPIPVAGLLATVWQYVPRTPPEPTASDLGSVLREFHSLGSPPFSLPSWNPVEDARRRMWDAEALGKNDRAFLDHWCDDLTPRVENLNARADRRLVHADAHVGNLLRETDGRVVLCDFDATCVGPWQVDLVAVAVGEARFGRAGAHQEMTAAYGYDVTADPDWSVLKESRELKMVAAAVPLLASSPGVAEEFQVRLRSIIHGDENARWTPFADLRGTGRARTTG